MEQVIQHINGRTDVYTVIEGFIPAEYSIWNAHLLIDSDGNKYLKLYNRKTSKDFTVDTSNLLALKLNPDLADKIDSLTAGGRCPKEVKRHLKCKNNYIRNKAEQIKPYIEILYNTVIK